MKRLSCIAALVFLSTQTTPTRADDADLHFAAHFGMSFAISAVSYGLAERALHAKPAEAFVFAAVTTLMVGATWKVLSLQPGDRNAGSEFGRSMIENACGVAGLGGSVVLFSW